MPLATCNGTSIYYEAAGPTDGAPLLLIHGFGAQLIAWHPGLCERLSDAGFRVIRFDNRDVGLSTKFDDDAPYTLLDMAADVAALVDYLDIGPVHVFGQSMGGMIAQRLAINHPDTVASLSLCYTTPSLEFVTDDPEFIALATEPAADTRQQAIRQWVRKERFSGSNGFDLDELAALVYDRCYCPDGMARQWAAVQTSGSVLEQLNQLAIPCAVIHGRADRLIPYQASVALADAIPDSDLHLYAELGHELPPDLWSDIVQIVGRTSQRGMRTGQAATSMTVQCPTG